MNFCIFRQLMREDYGQTLEIQRDLFENAIEKKAKWQTTNSPFDIS